MRCEVCGAPTQNEGSVCKMCLARRTSASTRPNIVSQAPAAADHRRQTLPSDNFSEIDQSSGIVLEGKYRLRDELGRGAMGTVFLADDLSLKRKVAVKFLLPELSDAPEYAERFRAEAIGMAAIRDNNVAQIFSYGTHGNNPYFVMEHLDGQTVEELIDSHNSRGFFVPLDEVLNILIQTVGGLIAIHRANTIHRDIKPANIMLTGDPMRTVIMDFGLVRNVKVDDEVRVLAGTPAYIAPELVEGQKDAARSPLTDIYSMGASAFELLTGSLPFDGESWVEILRKHITEIPPFPSERRPGIPEAFDEIILKAIAKSPAERYKTSEDFLADLVELRQMDEIDSRRVSSEPPAKYSNDSWGAAKRLRSTPGWGKKKTQGGKAKRSTGGRGRLLIADSDLEFRTFVHSVAKAAVPGCRVQSATDGKIALELMETFRPTVLVVDLNLPEVSGFELIATLRGEERYGMIEIIVVAEKGGAKEAKLLKTLKVQRFLTKPVDNKNLAEILRPALERYIPHYRSKPPPDVLDG